MTFKVIELPWPKDTENHDPHWRIILLEEVYLCDEHVVCSVVVFIMYACTVYISTEFKHLFLFDVFLEASEGLNASVLPYWHCFSKIPSLRLISSDNLSLVFCVWTGCAANRHCQCVRTHSESSNSVVIASTVKVACYDLFWSERSVAQKHFRTFIRCTQICSHSRTCKSTDQKKKGNNFILLKRQQTHNTAQLKAGL